jgi:hypothetical protein
MRSARASSSSAETSVAPCASAASAESPGSAAMKRNPKPASRALTALPIWPMPKKPMTVSPKGFNGRATRTAAQSPVRTEASSGTSFRRRHRIAADVWSATSSAQ